MTENSDDGPRTIQSVEKACAIIRALRELDGAGITELATHLDMSKGSVHTYLTTLKRNDLVTESGGRYQLGLSFLDFGEYVKRQNLVYQSAQDSLDEMATETGELARLVMREGAHGIYLAKAEGENAIETTVRPGQREYLHCTSQGKAILAHLPTSEVRRLIAEHGLPERTANTITEADELFDELEEIRSHGIAFSRSELTRGLRCVAAPIYGTDGTPIAAIGICGPTSRMQGDRFREEYPKIVRDKANVIEINMQMATKRHAETS
ncbi:IclR family transcriptional regulator [Natrialba chahannaoensis]|nr:IclR family transcriptional regulator [Natrialba chahannaoensis]